ncbi:MAG: hypothetical protein ACI83B_000425 [Sediminicola sp.]|jgi:hypothetical protein
MRKIIGSILVALLVFSLQSCSSVKVLSAWKGDKAAVASFKEKNILVIARTADNGSRLPFEIEIANSLRAKGFKATESFKKIPQLHPEKEMTEERRKLIQDILGFEGYNGIVITTLKDKSEVTSTSSSGIYMGGGYGSYYPGYYGGFNSYYSAPYAYGSYYSGFGGYVPLSTSTYTTTTYVLETVAYNLDNGKEDQLIAIVTTEVSDPKDAYKTAAIYTAKIMEALEAK